MPLTNSQYDTLRRDYDKRQSAAMQTSRAHIEEVYHRNPDILKIDQSIASLSVKQAQRLLEGNRDALQELKSSLKELTSKKNSMLAEMGYDLDYIEPQYHCKDCKDTGYVNGKKCHCFTQAAIDLVYTQSNLKKNLAVENFDHFNLNLFSDTEFDPVTGMSAKDLMAKAYEKAISFVQNFEQKDENLLFFGNTGVGKTFLSNCIAKALLDEGHSVIYFTAFQLFDIFRENAYNKSSGADEAYQNIFNCDLLIIDDLGSEVSNSFTASQLFMCINERVLRHKSTIISTNLTIEEMTERYSERVGSRIFQNYPIYKLIGSDLRIKTVIRA